MARFAVPIALLAGVVAFVLGLALATALGWSGVQALAVAVIACVLVAIAVWLLADSRSSAQVQSDEYRAQANAKVRQVDDKLNDYRKTARTIRDPGTATLVTEICNDVDVLFQRVRTTNPDSLQSTADVMAGHLDNLATVLNEYVAVQNAPQYYDNPSQILANDRDSIEGFHAFVTASIKLINQGEVLGADASRKMLAATKFTRAT